MRSSKALPTGSVFGDMGRYWVEIADTDATTKQLGLVEKVFVASEGLVLDLGCGTGRHAVPLCRAGYSVVGLDLSRGLLQLAKSRAAEASVCYGFVRADMRFLPFRPGIFVGIVSLDTSFGYLPSEEGDLQALKEAKRVLAGDGRLLLDVFNRDRMVQQHRQRFGYGLAVRFWLFVMRFWVRFPKLGDFAAGLFKWREYPSFYLLQKRMVDAQFGELQDLWLVHDKQGESMAVFVHIVRLYGLLQLQALFEKAGFHVKIVYGNYKMEKYAETSSRLIVVAEQGLSNT